MFVTVYCSNCQRPLRMRESYQGKRLRCPGCSTLVVPVAYSEQTSITANPPPAPSEVVPAQTLSPRDNSPVPTAPRVEGRVALLPWMLFAPTVPALAVLAWSGLEVIWAALGVGLGSLCLLLGQRVRWPLFVRIATSLSLALLGYGSTLATPLLNTQKQTPMTTQKQTPIVRMGPTVAFAPSPANEIAPELLQQGKLPSVIASKVAPATRLTTVSAPSDRKSGELQPLLQLGELLALAVDARKPKEGSAYIATEDGQLKVFSYPQFKRRKTYSLEQPAYRLALAGQPNVLWAADCDPSDLQVNQHGDQPSGKGRLVTYVLPSATSVTKANAPLHPSRVLAVSGEFIELLASPDRKALYYLVRHNNGVSVGRMDAQEQQLYGEVPVPAKTRALCLTADGKTLYAGGKGLVTVIEAATLNVLRRQQVEADVYSIAADNEGHVFLAEQGQWTDLTCLDLSGEEPVLRSWNLLMHGRIYLKMAPDEYRLYVGSSSPITHHLDALLIHGNWLTTPPLVGMASATKDDPLEGEFFLTPDGRFLVNRWGHVF